MNAHGCHYQKAIEGISRMVDIEYLERKKTETVADHIRRCNDTKLSWAEQLVIDQLNYEIKQIKALKGEQE